MAGSRARWTFQRARRKCCVRHRKGETETEAEDRRHTTLPVSMWHKDGNGHLGLDLRIPAAAAIARATLRKADHLQKDIPQNPFAYTQSSFKRLRHVQPHLFAPCPLSHWGGQRLKAIARQRDHAGGDTKAPQVPNQGLQARSKLLRKTSRAADAIVGMQAHAKSTQNKPTNQARHVLVQKSNNTLVPPKVLGMLNAELFALVAALMHAFRLAKEQ